MISVLTSGLTELLGGFGKALAITPLASMAVKASGEVIAEAARGNAPVLTGTLRDSIEADASGLSVEVGPTVEYAPFVEYGTYKDSPQPFIGPAADAGTDDLANKLLMIGVSF
jgi:HK97 gp10 family phage protein